MKANDFFSEEGSLDNFLFMTNNTNVDNETTMEYLRKFTAIVKEGKKSDFTLILNPLEKREVGII